MTDLKESDVGATARARAQEMKKLIEDGRANDVFGNHNNYDGETSQDGIKGNRRAGVPGNLLVPK